MVVLSKEDGPSTLENFGLRMGSICKMVLSFSISPSCISCTRNNHCLVEMTTANTGPVSNFYHLCHAPLIGMVKFVRMLMLGR